MSIKSLIIGEQIYLKSSNNSGKQSVLFFQRHFSASPTWKASVYFILNIYLMEITPKKCIQLLLNTRKQNFVAAW